MARHMATKRLHNSDLKKLVCIFQAGVSKQDMKALPRRILSSDSNSSSSSNLCSSHSDLNACLLEEIWSWMKYELNTGVGRVVYPVILAGKLTEAEENSIRQIEPVKRMWDQDFSTDSSAPQGRQPVDARSSWTYQHDKCPACMLTRIGSDSKVLRALYAGMIARFPIFKLASHKLILADLGFHNLESPKSKRVRLVRYWIRATTTGDAALFEAVELGILIKKKYKELQLQDEHHRPSHQPSHGISTHHSSHQATSGAKIGPRPRTPTITPHTPLNKVGIHHAARKSPQSTSPLPRRRRSNSDETLAPHDSITPLLTGARTYTPNPRTPTSGPTIVNLPGFPGRTEFTSPSAVPAPLAPLKVRVTSSLYSEASEFSTILSYDNGPTTPDREVVFGLPRPGRHSVYAGFESVEEDPFEGADAEEGGGDDKKEKRVTRWSDLY